MEMQFNEQTLHELEEELHTQILPGTEIMTDVGSRHFVKGSSGVLVPQPSADPHDPLNWNLFWKSSTFVMITFMSFSQGLGPLSLAAIFPELIAQYNSDLPGVIQFTGVSILVLGFSNFIWVPLATSFGRRPVFLLSTLICTAASIWRANATTYESFMGASILNGIGAGPAETLQPTVIADVFFLHDRGSYNTIYFATYFGSLMIGPIIAGPMTLAFGPAAFWWLNTALTGATFVLAIFFFPETRWHRLHPDEVRSNVPSDPPSTKDVNKIDEQDPEKQGRVGMSDLGKTDTAAQDPYLGKGKPSRKQFALWQMNEHPLYSIAMDVWIPLKLFAFPIVEFASFVVSWSASCFLTVNLTQSQNFAAPPYNWSSTSVGLTNFAMLVGTVIGIVTAGPLSDWISAKLTKRNRGIREPEMRLLTLVPYVCIMILGNFINAFGYQYKWDWRVIVIIGYTCAGIQVAAIPAIASTYAIDSYKPVSGSIFVSITVNKNVWGYGFSLFITNWIVESGYVPPIMTNMSLTALWCLFGIVFWFFGKKFRYWTRNDKVHKM
jgi:MFS family permease